MLERTEQERLGRLYDTLREKLLDLSKKNRMLNYPIGNSRSKRQLQIVDEVLEEVYSRLVGSGASLRLIPLEEPAGIPPEEKTPEFLAALEHAKVADLDYQTKLEALIASGRDDEFAVQLLERDLRDQIRQAFDLPPRPRRTEVNRAEHARSLGIDPNPELSAVGTTAAHHDSRLQTLKFPDELESILEKIAADARLAEQEAGLSTLFLTFGFLEWYDSDTSEKPNYAPLVLLPVKLTRSKVRGRDAYDLSAREEGGETNVSLQRFLERDHGRALPDFGSPDPDEPASIEAYLEEVRTAIAGKGRWRVRRWLMLGHFAFSRIAIYEDTDPKRWTEHPVAHPLVGSLLSGYEAASDIAGRGFRDPEDYRIDDPEIEKVAPFLVHDADASQHSALIDVMKGKNLVIEGPPGTGKSQTITNVIANALASGKTVLFLAEKQAALDVVKRRMDSAGLGDFCLELHSDKASPKAVIKGLADRHALGGDGRPTAAAATDPIWATSRAEIAEYLRALHEADADSQTPFRLIWQSIRGRSRNTDAQAVLQAPLPSDAVNPTSLPELRGKIELYAAAAQGFFETHGHFGAASPWAVTPPGDVPAYDHELLLTALERLRSATVDLAALVDHQRALGFDGAEDSAILVVADASLPEPPDAAAMAVVSGTDVDRVEQGLDLLAAFFEATRKAATLDAAAVEQDVLPRAPELARRLGGGDLLTRTPADIFRRADQKIAGYRAFLDAVAAVGPAMEALGASLTTPASHIEAIATAIVSAGYADEIRASWIGTSGIEGPAFDRQHTQWIALRREETALRAVIPGFGVERWPSGQDLEGAIASLSKGGLGRLFGQKPGREMLERLRLPDTSSSRAILQRLEAHVRAREGFETNGEGASLLGDRWSGLATPFDAIADAVQLRTLLGTRLGPLPGGADVMGKLMTMAPAAIVALAHHRPSAEAYLARLGEFRNVADAKPLRDAMASAASNLEMLEGLLAVDPDRTLASSELPLSRLVAQYEALRALAAAEERLDASSIGEEIRRSVPDEMVLGRCRTGIEWLRAVRRSGLPQSLAAELVSLSAGAARKRLRDEAGERARRDAELADAREMLTPFGFSGLDRLSASELVAHLDLLKEHAAELKDFIALQRLRRPLHRLGLEQFLLAADEALLQPDRLPSIFDAAVARRRADAARRGSTVLSERSGVDLEARRRMFVERDRRKKQADRAAIRSALLRREVPTGVRSGSTRTWTGMHLLTREFPKQRAFTPVRSLLARAGDAVRALKPCFMMSPLSLAKFLSPGQFEFDLLVIDEASQMRPEDALGAMLRARQIVVVGDPKQLPPTSFFDRASGPVDDDGDGDEVEDESILERCEKVFGDVRRLKWHYRSRCESLIRFSNDAFYEGKLVTFPAAVPGSFSVDLVRVEGRFQGRRNLPEAERISEEAIAFMRDCAELDEPPTLGIVALNTEQRDLIQDLLWRLSTDDELVGNYMEKVEQRGEPLFVKNLENVQGDERDYVLISLTYGPAPDATAMAQRFGPINNKQGHRRLNVLFSRARIRIGLFASFGSTDVRAAEGVSAGVQVLKQYLEYAETRGRAVVRSIGGVADSDFEEEVAERLRSGGYEVELQVGVSGFRIDLGVRHPDRPDTFLAGIECDGAAYHRSRSARDRDRLREEVLRGLGWVILRVWSTDWFDNPAAQTEKLLKQLDNLRKEADTPHSGWWRFDRGADLDGAERQHAETSAPANDEPAAAAEASETSDGPIDPIEGAGDRVSPDAPQLPVHEHTQLDEGVLLLDSGGPLAETELAKALVAFRETVIRPAAADWAPQRSILRDGMIETFVRQRIVDPEDWFKRVPLYQRSGTDPSEKRRYLEPICAIVDRLGVDSPQAAAGTGIWATPPAGSEADLGFALTAPAAPKPRTAQPLPLPGFAVGSGDAGVYAPTDFVALGLTPRRDAFYDESYRPELRRLVAAVIETEGPVYEDVLAIRIARAHGMERTGATIRQIISGVVDQQVPRSTEEDRTVFWPVHSVPDRPFGHRTSPDGFRSHADTPIAELAGLALPFVRLGMDDEAIINRMAEHFDLGRLRAATRSRFGRALSLAKDYFDQSA